MVWELVFMLMILKIPVVYLCAVVWWAIRSEPQPLAGAQLRAPLEPPGCDWGRRRHRRPTPRGGRGGRPSGRFSGARRTASTPARRTAAA